MIESKHFVLDAPQKSDESDASERSTLKNLVTELKDVLHKIHEEKHSPPAAIPVNENNLFKYIYFGYFVT